jgi:hypothetical protein
VRVALDPVLNGESYLDGPISGGSSYPTNKSRTWCCS